MKKIIRGSIFYADLDPTIGSEQHGCRPVVIIQNDVGNKNSPTIIVAPITTKKDVELPTHILIKQFNKIRPNSVIMVEQIRVIDKARLKGFVDILKKEQLQEVDKALIKLFDINIM